MRFVVWMAACINLLFWFFIAVGSLMWDAPVSNGEKLAIWMMFSFAAVIFWIVKQYISSGGEKLW